MQRYIIHTIGQTYTAAELNDAIEWIEANRNGIGAWITEAKETPAGYEYDETAPILHQWSQDVPLMQSVVTIGTTHTARA